VHSDAQLTETSRQQVHASQHTRSGHLQRLPPIRAAATAAVRTVCALLGPLTQPGVSVEHKNALGDKHALCHMHGTRPQQQQTEKSSHYTKLLLHQHAGKHPYLCSDSPLPPSLPPLVWTPSHLIPFQPA
jgi:hypothetical protein